jgi:hypothetical protein
MTDVSLKTLQKRVNSQRWKDEVARTCLWKFPSVKGDYPLLWLFIWRQNEPDAKTYAALGRLIREILDSKKGLRPPIVSYISIERRYRELATDETNDNGQPKGGWHNPDTNDYYPPTKFQPHETTKNKRTKNAFAWQQRETTRDKGELNKWT